MPIFSKYPARLLPVYSPNLQINKGEFIAAGTRKLLFTRVFLSLVFLFLVLFRCIATELSDLGLYVLPYPQRVTIGGDAFVLNNNLKIVLNKNHSSADEFAANELANDLKEQWSINSEVSTQKGGYSIIFIRKKSSFKSQLVIENFSFRRIEHDISITANRI